MPKAPYILSIIVYGNRKEDSPAPILQSIGEQKTQCVQLLVADNTALQGENSCKAAHNILQKISGRYVTFVHAGAKLRPEALQELCAELTRTSAAIFHFGEKLDNLPDGTAYAPHIVMKAFERLQPVAFNTLLYWARSLAFVLRKDNSFCETRLLEAFILPPAAAHPNLYADAKLWAAVCKDSALWCDFMNSMEKTTVTEATVNPVVSEFNTLEREAAKLPRQLYEKRVERLWASLHSRDNFGALMEKDFSAACHIAGKTSVKSKKIRNIAIFSAYFGLGGAERVATLLAELFLKVGYRVIFLGNVPPQETDYPYPDCISRVTLPNNVQERHAVVTDVLREHSVDVCILVTHYAATGMYDVASCRASGIFTVMMEHNTFFYPFYNHVPHLFPLRQKAFPLTNALVCLSEDIMRTWRSAGYEQALHINNPLTFTSQPSILPRAERKNRLLYVNKLNDEKGIWQIPQILYEVKKKIPDAELFILGRFHPHPGDREAFLQLVQEYGLKDSIQLVGHVPNVVDYYTSAALFILPSRFEGAPMTVMEAKAFGIPTVSYHLDYMDNAFRDEAQGVVTVPRNDVSAFAQKIVSVLNNEPRWQALSKAALKSLERFSDEIILEQWMRLFSMLEQGFLVPKDALPICSKELLRDFSEAIDTFPSERLADRDTIVKELDIPGKFLYCYTGPRQ